MFPYAQPKFGTFLFRLHGYNGYMGCISIFNKYSWTVSQFSVHFKSGYLGTLVTLTKVKVTVNFNFFLNPGYTGDMGNI